MTQTEPAPVPTRASPAKLQTLLNLVDATNRQLEIVRRGR